ncbi:MAG: HNH endonuclease, partial [Micrococcales bacterium]
MWSQKQQRRLRAEACAWLAARTQDGLHALTTEEIGEFTFDGERFALMDRQRGIRKPASFDSA